MKIKVNYFAPTPRFMRVIGDTLLAASMMMLPYSGDSDVRMWIVAGIAGKFLTNMFADPEVKVTEVSSLK
jgi:hypothetical protein